MRAPLICGLLASAMVATAFADHHVARTRKPVVEHVVQPEEGAYKITVEGRSALLRLPITAMSGSTISAPKIQGPAKLIRIAEVAIVGESGPSIGAIRKDFVFRNTGVGKVNITFNITTPTGGGGNESFDIDWR